MKVILLLSGLGILSLFAELFRFKKYLYPLILIGILGAIGVAVSYFRFDDGVLTPLFNGMVDNNHHIPDASIVPGHIFSSMLEFGPTSVLMSIIVLSTTFLWLLMSKEFFTNDSSK